MFHSIFCIGLIFSASLMVLDFSKGEAKQEDKITVAQSDEEAFLIRRIAEFWKDGDFPIVKTQIVRFLDQYPESSSKDFFLGILGDIYLQENNYEAALKTYESVRDQAVIAKTFVNKLQCYYELDQYEDLVKEGRPYLSSNTDEAHERKEELHFLLGEALFRGALALDDEEKKRALAREAQSYYHTLTEGEYHEVSRFAMAEIDVILGDYEKGAAAYRSLASQHPQMKEDLLFQVGSLEARYDKEKAIETFKEVQEMEGKKAREAAFNLIALLFQKRSYEEVIHRCESLEKGIPEEHLPSFQFMVGKSYFCIKQYQNATSSLKKYIDSTYIPSDQLKNALLIQMTCAHQIGDEALFSNTFDKLDSLFPGDEEIPKALFMHAMLLKEQGAISKADEKLKMIKTNYRAFDHQESFLFEYGLLAHQNERWLEAYEAFNTYVATFEDSHRTDGAWKLFLSSALNLYKHCEEEAGYSKSMFLQDLQKVSVHLDCLNESEKQDYALLYAKTAYELNEPLKALHCLQDHIFKRECGKVEHMALAEAHFIAGLCFSEIGSDPSAFCMHLEKAMELNPDRYDSASSHLHLYNAYLSLAGYGEEGRVSFDTSQQKEFIDSAAQHLEEAIAQGDTPIKKENRLWLADHYYQQVKNAEENWQEGLSSLPDMMDAAEKASFHYQSLLFLDHQLIPITADTLYFEHEVLKFAKLLGYQGKHQKKLDLLKQLLKQECAQSELNWNFQNEAFFELGTAYEALGEKEKAYETYSFIHTLDSPASSVLASYAVLEETRLHFELLEEELRNENNEEMLSILNNLKELQIRKHPNSEPVHLEAALEYAKIRSLISDNAQKDARYLFFLSRIKEDFMSQEDLVTKDYLKILERQTSKKDLFDAYMKFIDAEKMRLEAKNFYRQERLGEMEELHENALTLYNEIENNRHTPLSLCKRVSESIQEINALNAY